MRLGTLIAALSVVASAASAQEWIGQPGVSSEVEAALTRARKGDMSTLADLARAGRPDAEALIGVLLAFAPNASAADRVNGCSYLQAASAVRADAMHFLAEAYQYGKCGPQDLPKAMSAFHKAGDMGLAKSRCAEGNLLLATGGDAKRVIGLCREGAEAGDADAQTDLGNFYLQGRIVPKDVVEARRWYEKAAAQKQANAAFVLGQIYWNGDGVAKDNAAAARNWRIAFEGGRLEAASLLGDEALARAGRGTGKWDVAGLEEARAWYAKAAQLADAGARNAAADKQKLVEQLVEAMKRQH